MATERRSENASVETRAALRLDQKQVRLRTPSSLLQENPDRHGAAKSPGSFAKGAIALPADARRIKFFWVWECYVLPLVILCHTEEKRKELDQTSWRVDLEVSGDGLLISGRSRVDGERSSFRAADVASGTVAMGKKGPKGGPARLRVATAVPNTADWESIVRDVSGQKYLFPRGTEFHPDKAKEALKALRRGGPLKAKLCAVVERSAGQAAEVAFSESVEIFLKEEARGTSPPPAKRPRTAADPFWEAAQSGKVQLMHENSQIRFETAGEPGDWKILLHAPEGDLSHLLEAIGSGEAQFLWKGAAQACWRFKKTDFITFRTEANMILVLTKGPSARGGTEEVKGG